MRLVAVGVLAVLVLAGLPVQAEEVDALLVEDAAGDVMMATPDGTVPAQSGDFADLDLRGVGVFAEDAASITFFVEVEDLASSSQNPAPFGDPTYWVYFRSAEQGYRARVVTALESPANDAVGRDAGSYARLEIEVGQSQYRSIAQAEATLDFAADRVFVTVPRDAIVDHNQAPLSLGRTLDGLWAEATSMGWFAFPVGQTQQGGDPLVYAGPPMASDRAPDDVGDLDALPSYLMTTGEVKQKGGIVAVSDDPVRWTNGEASTLRFVATVTNTHDQDIPVSVAVAKAKSEWTVAFSDSLTIPRGESINVTFLVTIPFSHNHGSIHMFEARFTSLDGQHFAAADMGVYWPAVPQPAGHHDTIWLHSLVEDGQSDTFFGGLGSDVHVWMSAIEEEETDQSVEVPAMFTLPPNTFTDGKGLAYWRVALEPELRMGLDFRPEDVGTMQLSLKFPVPVVDPQVRVQLSHIEVHERRGRNDDGYGQRTPLAAATADPVSGTVSGAASFELELQVSPEADKIPYGKSTNLVLDIIVEATFMAGFGQSDGAGNVPHLVPGGTHMQLPLDEYVEPVDLTFRTDGSLELLATADGQQREVNAGRTVVYVFDLKYHGSNATTFETLITGTGAEWAYVVGDTEFTMEPHGERRVGLAVKAPAGTSPGERADLTLTVLGTENAAVQAGINTVTTVVAGKDIPDEADRGVSLNKELTTKKDASAVGLAGVLGVLGLVLRRRTW